MTKPPQYPQLQHFPSQQPYPPPPYRVGAQVALDKKDRVKKHHGMAVTALVLGIIGTVFGCIPLTFVVAFVGGVLAIIFGLFGWRWGVGKAGAILGIIAVLLGIVGAVIVNSAVNDLNSSVNCIDSGHADVEMDAC